MTSALLLGLAGSLHCIGMCGPLVLALPLSRAERWRAVLPLLVYQAGRLATYAVLGLLFGLLGKGFALAGWQQVVSVGIGAAMLLSALAAFGPNFWTLKFPGEFQSPKILKKRLAEALRGRGLFVAGLLNGLLPCGMVYVALAGAVASTNGWETAVYMLFFGLGTLPALLAVGLAGRVFGAAARRRFRLARPVLLALAGWLLIQRGLEIDLSAWDAAVPGAVFECH